MFGDNSAQGSDVNNAMPPADATTAPLGGDMSDPAASATATPAFPPMDMPAPVDSPSATPAPAADDVAAPATEPTKAATVEPPLDLSAIGGSPSTPAMGGASSSTTTPLSADSDDLLNIKQQALQQLTPLVGHLDQTPEEKFRTTMMMIQAADNSALLQDAYNAAQQITDEKIKAQALLDVINEINYFTQHHEQK